MSDVSYYSTSLIGGVLTGASASILLAYQGRVAGISGILDAALDQPRRSLGWRLPFLVGLVLAGAVMTLLVPQVFGTPVRGLVPLSIAGVLVGFGTRLGSGCTSGHGVCGLSRLSLRSAVATGTFIAAGMIATYVLLHLGDRA